MSETEPGLHKEGIKQKETVLFFILLKKYKKNYQFEFHVNKVICNKK